MKTFHLQAVVKLSTQLRHPQAAQVWQLEREVPSLCD